MPARFADHTDRRGDAGFAYPLALLVVTALVTLALGAVVFALSSTRGAGARYEQVAALYAAESGINEALYRLREADWAPEDGGFASSPAVMGEDASYAVAFEEAGAYWVIVSTRTVGNATRTVRVTVHYTLDLFPANLPQDYPILITEPGYEPPEVTFTIPDPPPGTGPGTPLSGGQTVGPGTYHFTSINLGKDESLTVNGPATLYVTGPVHMENKASFTLSGGVTLYVTGGFTAENNCTFDFTGNNAVYVAGDLVFDNNAALATDGRTAFFVAGDLTLANNADVGTPPSAQLVVYLTTDAEHTVTLSCCGRAMKVNLRERIESRKQCATSCDVALAMLVVTSPSPFTSSAKGGRTDTQADLQATI